MPLLIPKPGPPRDSFRIARDRGLLPSELSSQEQREQFASELRAKSVFAARATNETFLYGIKKVVDSMTGDERAKGDERKAGMTLAEGRATLKRLLQALGYTPEGGFPGDEGEVPPAVAGTLQDLSSDRRLNLILETQIALMSGRAQRDQGRDAIDFFPAWELVRIELRSEPRDWFERFEEAGGTILIDAQGRKRLIAHKDDPVWDALGDSSFFSDALDVDHPPFAFSSGMGWRNVSRREWEELGGTEPPRRDDAERKDRGMLPENVGTFRDSGSVDRLRKIFEKVDVNGSRVRVSKHREDRRSRRANLRERYFEAFGKEVSS